MAVRTCFSLLLLTVAILRAHSGAIKKGGGRQFVTMTEGDYEAKHKRQPSQVDVQKRPGGRAFLNSAMAKRPGGRAFLGAESDGIKRQETPLILQSEPERRKRPGGRGFFSPNSYYDLYYPHDLRSYGGWYRRKRPGGRSFFDGHYGNAWMKKDYDWNDWMY